MNESQLSETLHDLREAFATQQQVRKRPVTPVRIARILDSLDGSIAAVRNRALLLIGVAGALGNSELAAIRIESLKWHEKGLTIGLPQDDGVTQTVEISFATGDQPCAVKALKDWLTIANLQEGKVFRSVAFSGAIREGISPNSISRLVQGSEDILSAVIWRTLPSDRKFECRRWSVAPEAGGRGQKKYRS